MDEVLGSPSAFLVLFMCLQLLTSSVKGTSKQIC